MVEILRLKAWLDYTRRIKEIAAMEAAAEEKRQPPKEKKTTKEDTCT